MTQAHAFKKTLALDVGDTWTGSALSDSVGITAQPYKTVKTAELIPFLQQVIIDQKIKQVVIGYPQTMRGTQSEQTKKVIAFKEKLEEQFTDINWLFWDERLSSKRAATAINTKKIEERIKAHSIAAAYILSSFLENQRQYTEFDF